MHIARPERSEERLPDAQAALEEINTSVIRQGPVCTPDCTCAKFQHCSRTCPYIAQTLSSDPVKHPLEHNIAPLAFEIKRLGIFTPCWSCEGHNDQHNKLLKMPAVWFYAHSVTHVRVLGDSIGDMYYAHRLSSPWHVRLCFSDPGNVNTTFSLEPAPYNGEITLPKLHNDIRQIAEELEDRMIQKAQDLKKL